MPEEEQIITPPQEFDFYDKLLQRATGRREIDDMVTAIIRGVKDNNPAALKTLEKALNEGRYKNEQKIKVTNEQIQNIILLAAARIRKSEAST